MKDRIMDIISSYADIDTAKIDIYMTFEELNLDYDDILELLIPIEEEYELHSRSELVANISIDMKISRFIDLIKECL